MTVLMPGPSGGGNTWIRVYDVDFSLEATAPIPEGTNTFGGRSIFIRNRGHNRDGLLQMVNGKGVKVTPDSGATAPANMPGLQLSFTTTLFSPLTETEIGNDPPIRTMMEIESYSGGDVRDYIAFGPARNPWDLWTAPNLTAMCGICADGSPAVWLYNSVYIQNGAVTTATYLDGKKFCVTECLSGFMGGITKLKWGESADFNLARMGATFRENADMSTVWANSTMSSAGGADYPHANPYIICAARGVTNTGTFYVKRLIVEIKRQ